MIASQIGFRLLEVIHSTTHAAVGLSVLWKGQERTQKVADFEQTIVLFGRTVTAGVPSVRLRKRYLAGAAFGSNQQLLHDGGVEGASSYQTAKFEDLAKSGCCAR
jgi:hypothetical protein